MRAWLAQAADPGIGAGQSPVERLDLANMTARGASLLGLIESVDASPRDELFQLGVMRINRSDAEAIAALGFGPQLVGLREQAAGVEGHHVDVGL